MNRAEKYFVFCSSMPFIFFFIYFLILGFIISKSSFVVSTGISKRTLWILYFIKIAAGCIATYLILKLYPGNDYEVLSKEAFKEYSLLIKKPLDFFKDIVVSPYGHYDGFFSSENSFWNNLRNNILIKFTAILNVFSGGNIYINTLFYNFLGFFGHIALFKIFINIYPDKKRRIITGSLLLPSLLFFSSTMQKDNIVFLLIALFSYCLYFNKSRFITLLILVVLFFIRSYVVIALIPAATAFIISRKRKFAFPVVYSCFLFLIFVFSFNEKLNPLKIIVNKQEAFLNLPEAKSAVSVYELQPTIKSFLQGFPRSFYNVFFRPLPWQNKSLAGILLGLEWLFFSAILLFFIFRGRKIENPFAIYSLVFAVSVFFIIGYIVPNAGSIIRYKSIYLPFLILPAICNINFKNI